MRFRVGLGLSCALALGGCDFAPDYQPPNVALPSQFSDASDVRAFPAGAEWWRVFHDRELDQLEVKVDAANPDLKAAFANYQAAKAHAAAAGGRSRVGPAPGARGISCYENANGS